MTVDSFVGLPASCRERGVAARFVPQVVRKTVRVADDCWWIGILAKLAGSVNIGATVFKLFETGRNECASRELLGILCRKAANDLGEL
jgi:hypothetical protein